MTREGTAGNSVQPSLRFQLIEVFPLIRKKPSVHLPVFSVPARPEGLKDQLRRQHWAIQNRIFFRPSAPHCSSVCTGPEEISPRGGRLPHNLLQPSESPPSKPVRVRPDDRGPAALLHPPLSPTSAWAASRLGAPAQQPVLLPYSPRLLLLLVLLLFTHNPDPFSVSLLSQSTEFPYLLFCFRQRQCL